MNLDHELWLQRNRPTQEELAYMRRKCETGPYRLPFTVFVLCGEDAGPKLEDTVRSIDGQIYPFRDTKIIVGTVDISQELSSANGEFSIILEAGDILTPEALACLAFSLHDFAGADIVYSDHDEISSIGIRLNPFFKPQWSPDLFMALDYIGRACAIRTSLLREVGGLRSKLARAASYDLLLRIVEKTSRVLHVPRLLMSLRKSEDHSSECRSAVSSQDLGLGVVEESLRRQSCTAILSAVEGGGRRVRYRVSGDPKVSIIIPMKDKIHLLHACLDSMRRQASSVRYEIVIVDNGSREPLCRDYLRGLGADCKILRYDGRFHYPRINNWAARQCSGDLLLFLNNDTEILSPDWLEELAGFAQRPGVGAVGPRLVYPDGSIQQQGWVYSNGGFLPVFRGLMEGEKVHFNISNLARNCTGLSGACLMISRSNFERVGGFHEGFQVAYSDIDLCLNIARRGQRVVCTPHAVLVHHESSTRGPEFNPRDWDLLQKRWWTFCMPCDPYFNPNLTMRQSQFIPKADISMRREPRGVRRSWRRGLLFGIPRLQAFSRTDDAIPPKTAVSICDLERFTPDYWRKAALGGAAIIMLPFGCWLWRDAEFSAPLRWTAFVLWAAVVFWFSLRAFEGILESHLGDHVEKVPESYRGLMEGAGFYDFAFPHPGGMAMAQACSLWRAAGNLEGRKSGGKIPLYCALPALLLAAMMLNPNFFKPHALVLASALQVWFIWGVCRAWEALIERLSRSELRLLPLTASNATIAAPTTRGSQGTSVPPSGLGHGVEEARS